MVERRPRVWEIASLILGRVKTMTYKIDTCRFLAWRLALIGSGKDWLAQCPDNVTEENIGSWCRSPDFSMGQHYEVTMKSQVGACSDITLAVAKT